MNASLIKIAASTLAIGASIAGFSPLVQDAISEQASAADAQASQSAREAASDARAALGIGDTAGAIAAAERAVSILPRNAEYRHLLGQSYLSAGRLDSAELSFEDALSIDPSLDRTAFNLALVEIAQGRKLDAREELSALEGKVGASDLGLAMALAGEHDRAIEILIAAARADAGDRKARQNLALSYALAGRWGEARVTAAQDISMADLDQRMQEWASFAQPANSWAQVAGMLNIHIDGTDPGQPERLALAPQQNDTMMAAADADLADTDPVVAYAAPVPSAPISSVPVPAYAPSALDRALAQSSSRTEPVAYPYVTATADAESAPSSEFVVEQEQTFYAQTTPADYAQATPADYAQVTPPVAPRVAQSPRSAPRQVEAPVASEPQSPTPVAAPVSTPAEPQHRAPEPQNGDGRYMVQIGAYSRRTSVELAWERAVSSHALLADYTPNRASIERGQTLYRLAFGGFDNRNQAAGMCRQLKASGLDCFVRARAGDTPLQMAQRAADTAHEFAAQASRHESAMRVAYNPLVVTPMQMAADVLIQIAQLV